MPSIVITGAPGAGKTTLLAELARIGYPTVSESAREFISERLARGEPPRPDAQTFAQEVFRRDKLKYLANTSESKLVFFDRCAVESLGMVHESRSLSPAALQAELSELHFHRTVFLLPPWQEIYTTDSERDHPYEHALRVHASLLAWYTQCGYSIHEVPRLGVVDRARHLLRALGQAQAPIDPARHSSQ